MTTAEKLYTRAEFVALPRDVIRGCELLNGRIVKKHAWDGEGIGMTPQMLAHAEVVRLIWRALDRWSDNHPNVRASAEALFDVGADRDRTRRPDLALMEGELPADAEAILSPAPMMAVEVISPSNPTLDLWDKVEEYFAAGVLLVWLALPPHRTVVALRPERAAVFRSGDIITGEPVLPGFSCPAIELFPSAVNPTG